MGGFGRIGKVKVWTTKKGPKVSFGKPTKKKR
jgi:hypothetical protein